MNKHHDISAFCRSIAQCESRESLDKALDKKKKSMKNLTDNFERGVLNLQINVIRARIREIMCQSGK